MSKVFLKTRKYYGVFIVRISPEEVRKALEADPNIDKWAYAFHESNTECIVTFISSLFSILLVADESHILLRVCPMNWNGFGGMNLI